MTNAIDLPKIRSATEQEGGRRVETDHDGVLVYAKRVVALSGGPFLKRSRTRQIDRTLTRHFCARNMRLVLEVAEVRHGTYAPIAIYPTLWGIMIQYHHLSAGVGGCEGEGCFGFSFCGRTTATMRPRA